MACRRCSLCGLNFRIGVMKCSQCGGRTDYIQNADPDVQHKAGDGEEYELRGDAELMYEPERHGKIIAWRVTCFERAGVGTVTATSLAVRRGIDRVTVERMVAAGATDAVLRDVLL